MDSNERAKEGSTFPKNIFSHVVSTCQLSFCTQSGFITCIRLVIYYTLLLLYIIRYTFIKLMLFVSAIIIFLLINKETTDSSSFLQTSEKTMLTKEQGEGKAAEASEDVIYKIDVPANRSA